MAFLCSSDTQPCLQEEGIQFITVWASPVAQMVRNPPAMQETRVRSLSQEDPLEEDMETHSSILAWRIPKDGGTWWDTVHGVTKGRI